MDKLSLEYIMKYPKQNTKLCGPSGLQNTKLNFFNIIYIRVIFYLHTVGPVHDILNDKMADVQKQRLILTVCKNSISQGYRCECLGCRLPAANT